MMKRDFEKVRKGQEMVEACRAELLAAYPDMVEINALYDGTIRVSIGADEAASQQHEKMVDEIRMRFPSYILKIVQMAAPQEEIRLRRLKNQKLAEISAVEGFSTMAVEHDELGAYMRIGILLEQPTDKLNNEQIDELLEPVREKLRGLLPGTRIFFSNLSEKRPGKELKPNPDWHRGL